MTATAANPNTHLANTINDHEKRLAALETQQYHVTTDPTGKTGDKNHGHAVYVTGYLMPICAINAYGAASYRTGSWVQV